jgi:hypothetical protein
VAPAGPDRFALTPLGEPLRADRPDSVRPTVLLSGEDWHWRAWGALLGSVQTGRPAFEAVHGKDLYRFLAADPDAAAVFDAGMQAFAAADDPAILDAGRFEGARTVVDVGAGSGSLAIAVLGACPGATAVLLELPYAVEGCRRRVEAANLAGRCRVEAGDFFDAVPAGGDVYVLKCVLHNWDDTRAAAILRSCHRAMADGARLLVMETVMPAAPTPSVAALLDLEMLVTTPGGRERTEDEFGALLEATGFRPVGVTPTASGISIVEAVRRRA